MKAPGPMIHIMARADWTDKMDKYTLENLAKDYFMAMENRHGPMVMFMKEVLLTPSDMERVK